MRQTLEAGDTQFHTLIGSGKTNSIHYMLDLLFTRKCDDGAGLPEGELERLLAEEAKEGAPSCSVESSGDSRERRTMDESGTSRGWLSLPLGCA